MLSRKASISSNQFLHYHVFQATEASWSEVRNVGMPSQDVGNHLQNTQKPSQCSACRLHWHDTTSSLHTIWTKAHLPSEWQHMQF